MAYAKRYAGGFLDNAGGGTPIDSTFLNAVEAALLKLFAVDASADGQALLWSLANSRYQPALIGNANIDPAAAIAKSKLAALNIADADIAAAAGIAASKLGGNIPASKLQGYPGAAPKVLRGDGTWGPGSQGIYRKTTAKQVVNTVAETDLLNGEITVGAGVLSASGVLRLTAWGDWIQNSGASCAFARMKLKLGATTLFDTNTSFTTSWGANASRFCWRIVAEIMNLGVTNAQWAAWQGQYVGSISPGDSVFFTTGEGSRISQNNMLLDAGGNSAAVDMTAAQALALTVTLPAASASLDMTLKGALVEVL